jgi:hypothetical protein
MSSDTTIVITGHLHPNSLQVLHIYSNVAKHIILSCFSTDNFGMFQTYPLPDHCKVLLLSNPEISDETKQCVKEVMPFQQPFSDCFFYQHVYLQQAAIPYVTTKYVIFVKSDEFFTDWTELLRSIKENPFKLTFISTGCQKVCTFPYLFSKHIIAGRTELVKEACEGLWKTLLTQRTDVVHDYLDVLQIEKPSFFVDLMQLYVACYLDQNKIPHPRSPEDKSRHILEWMSIISLDQMGMYAYNMGTFDGPNYITNNTQSNQACGVGFESLNPRIEDVIGKITKEDHQFMQAVVACKSFFDDDWFQCLEIAERIGKIDYEPYRKIIEEANHQANLG